MPRDFQTELSAADISSQSFGLPNMSFKPGCSTDITIRDAGVLGGGLRPSLSAQLRECKHTQWYKNVGLWGELLSIDVSRYKGYDELRHDLSRRFGIEGQLEDSHRTEWKLVYVDHKRHTTCWRLSLRGVCELCSEHKDALSSTKVQQMSSDGDLGLVPKQACSGTDSGNAWRGHYDDNTASSCQLLGLG